MEFPSSIPPSSLPVVGVSPVFKLKYASSHLKSCLSSKLFKLTVKHKTLMWSAHPLLIPSLLAPLKKQSFLHYHLVVVSSARSNTTTNINNPFYSNTHRQHFILSPTHFPPKVTSLSFISILTLIFHATLKLGLIVVLNIPTSAWMILTRNKVKRRHLRLIYLTKKWARITRIWCFVSEFPLFLV